VRLIAWAPCLLPGTSQLPTLDPDSLYAASVLQARRVAQYTIGSASSLLHRRIPCLEEASTSVLLAQDIESIEGYAERHAGEGAGPSMLEEDKGVDGQDGAAAKRTWAKRKALECYLVSTLHPLIYQSLFSQDLYSSHTSKAYQSGLSLLNRNSLTSRLRSTLRQHYATKGKCLQEKDHSDELAAILLDSNARQYIREEEIRERRELADRGGISMNGKQRAGMFGLGREIRGDGLLQEEKAAAAKTFTEMRVS
jgi:hypothetical protein